MKSSADLWTLSLHSCRRQEVVLLRLQIGHCCLIHRYSLLCKEAFVSDLSCATLPVRHLPFFFVAVLVVACILFQPFCFSSDFISLTHILSDSACLPLLLSFLRRCSLLDLI